MKPVYGRDLCDVVRIIPESPNCLICSAKGWNCGQGLVNCQATHAFSNPHHPACYWRQTQALSSVVHTPEQYLKELKELLEMYVLMALVKTALCCWFCD